MEIVAGIDSKVPNRSFEFPAYTAPNECAMPADVIVDFSTASAVPELVEWNLDRRMPMVICTTGLSEASNELISKAAKQFPILRSANMSLGINMIAAVLRRVSKTLSDAGFDIEILEKHHNKKLDAPSGTAIMLADSINSSGDFTYICDRSARREKRSTNEIGISSIRGGTIVGEHDVIFAGHDEIIELRHTALSRDVFAAGALIAAQFLVSKPPGMYSMKDVFYDI
jgi:4-hydroxy-tetrahydrodipicolinate reductase